MDAFCIPTRGTTVPADPDWYHEIKYDGFRMLVLRDGDRIRLITRGGYDWAKSYPWIVQAALPNFGRTADQTIFNNPSGGQNQSPFARHWRFFSYP